jgi:hypothetical protein
MLKCMSVTISGEPRDPKGKGELSLGPMVGEMAMNARFTVTIKRYSETKKRSPSSAVPLPPSLTSPPLHHHAHRLPGPDQIPR